ncbi:hypothetical protein ABN36_18220 [Salmonella enterica subsp. enterica]|uniref:hypothetical protein n=1 Tax=Salmonella enterica TaxID=28901 RepID=UPI00105A664D|nr:hypothetical protein [Salmonella enterica]EBZ0015912.1 hypothetical protein [Salmonella enterica subsp. enterica serovar Suberu]ECH9540599.1 hypothetical protein [Salmonella enterica subsp. enterica]ECM8230939.1 hypothetical protein [Salmonella enterica subsp. enterica serovar Kentucky]EGI6509415.1 hypothetical protein [Salmonella enterica subsp. enterica serovar Durham]EHW9667330.1 hypothetical protein [Salmonella enterica subsp. enterica serovar Agbeni]
MTPATLPQKLWRPVAEIKRYLEKMPEGVTLKTLSHKVGGFGSLSKREKASLVAFLKQRESVLIIQAKPVNGKNLITFLRHKKYGYPQSIPGYVYPIKAPALVAAPEKTTEEAKPMETITTTPEALRRHAEQLLKAAEEAEKRRGEAGAFNKKLAPIRLEIGQAAGKMQRKLDEFIDCMDEMNKAIKKLKDLSV